MATWQVSLLELDPFLLWVGDSYITYILDPYLRYSFLLDPNLPLQFSFGSLLNARVSVCPLDGDTDQHPLRVPAPVAGAAGQLLNKLTFTFLVIIWLLLSRNLCVKNTTTFFKLETDWILFFGWTNTLQLQINFLFFGFFHVY